MTLAKHDAILKQINDAIEAETLKQVKLKAKIESEIESETKDAESAAMEIEEAQAEALARKKQQAIEKERAAELIYLYNTGTSDELFEWDNLQEGIANIKEYLTDQIEREKYYSAMFFSSPKDVGRNHPHVQPIDEPVFDSSILLKDQITYLAEAKSFSNLKDIIDEFDSLISTKEEHQLNKLTGHTHGRQILLLGADTLANLKELEFNLENIAEYTIGYKLNNPTYTRENPTQGLKQINDWALDKIREIEQIKKMKEEKLRLFVGFYALQGDAPRLTALANLKASLQNILRILKSKYDYRKLRLPEDPLTLDLQNATDAVMQLLDGLSNVSGYIKKETLDTIIATMPKDMIRVPAQGMREDYPKETTLWANNITTTILDKLNGERKVAPKIKSLDTLETKNEPQSSPSPLRIVGPPPPNFYARNKGKIWGSILGIGLGVALQFIPVIGNLLGTYLIYQSLSILTCGVGIGLLGLAIGAIADTCVNSANKNREVSNVQIQEVKPTILIPKQIKPMAFQAAPGRSLAGRYTAIPGVSTRYAMPVRHAQLSTHGFLGTNGAKKMAEKTNIRPTAIQPTRRHF